MSDKSEPNAPTCFGCPSELVAYRLGQLEKNTSAHGERLWSLEKTVSRMYGAVALAIVLIPPLTAFAVKLVK